ncbi:hypothetical protein LIER_03945 [Lithospermum erythrorhizon]|uniref:Uncharacterized protein n=1 Tax=Lithospermum erythrorhizon TaxID=34254 RepID=A0AAV3NVP4_LITER
MARSLRARSLAFFGYHIYIRLLEDWKRAFRAGPRLLSGDHERRSQILLRGVVHHCLSPRVVCQSNWTLSPSADSRSVGRVWFHVVEGVGALENDVNSMAGEKQILKDVWGSKYVNLIEQTLNEDSHPENPNVGEAKVEDGEAFASSVLSDPDVDINEASKTNKKRKGGAVKGVKKAPKKSKALSTTEGGEEDEETP